MPSLAQKKYFVYTLALDKKNRYVFYVGKGSGERPHGHAYDAFGKFSLKAGVIRYLYDHKWSYWIRIVNETDDEQEAFWLEKKALVSYPYQSLTNVHGGYNSLRLIPKIERCYSRWCGTLTDAVSGDIVVHIIERHEEFVLPRLLYAYDRLVVPPYFKHIRYQFFEYSTVF